MYGQPVWLGRLTLDRDDCTLPVPEWTATERLLGQTVLSEAMGGVGEASRQRLYSANWCLRLYRATMPADLTGCSRAFLEAPRRKTAGGQHELLWESEPGPLSTRPCVQPTRHVWLPERPDLWAPQDCGACPSCIARRVLERAAALPEPAVTL